MYNIMDQVNVHCHVFTWFFLYSLKDLKLQKGFSDTSGILDILKHIRKIPVPPSYRCADAKAKEEPATNTHQQEEEKAQGSDKKFKGLRVKTAACRSRSKSPKNQKLSNMIVGSNMTARNVVKNTKQKNSSSTIFSEREDHEEPGTPCSETPFILTTPEVEWKRRPASPWTEVSWRRFFFATLHFKHLYFNYFQIKLKGTPYYCPNVCFFVLYICKIPYNMLTLYELLRSLFRCFTRQVKWLWLILMKHSLNTRNRHCFNK